MKNNHKKSFSIAVCGAALGTNDSKVKKKAAIIGREIAKKGCVLRTGGCSGYPQSTSDAAFFTDGEAIAVSPAHNAEEHKQKYNYPTENFTKIIFTGLGIPGRNLPLVQDADAVIIVGGQHGTMIEYGIALHFEKPVGVLTGSGGITKIARQIAKICRKKGKKQKIIYESNPKVLVSKLIKAMKTEKK